MREYIAKRVHEMYWEHDINCARTALICLSELFEIPIEPQTLWSAVGLHGAGGYRAQCGLVEGALMFIGIYLHTLGKGEDEIVSFCHDFAAAFDRREPFYSESNMAHLRRGVEAPNAGKGAEHDMNPSCMIFQEIHLFPAVPPGINHLSVSGDMCGFGVTGQYIVPF